MALKRPKGHAIMSLCMAATYDPDPRAPLGCRISYNAAIAEIQVAVEVVKTKLYRSSK